MLNITYTNEVDEREARSLLEFKKKFDRTRELIVLTKDLEAIKLGIRFIPLWKWLLD